MYLPVIYILAYLITKNLPTYLRTYLFIKYLDTYTPPIYSLIMGPNFLRCTKILSQHHLYLFIYLYHVKIHLWMFMIEFIIY
jgi:hypothetical protein